MTHGSVERKRGVALASNTIDERMHTLHAHPTLSEALMEAAQDVKGESVRK